MLSNPRNSVRLERCHGSVCFTLANASADIIREESHEQASHLMKNEREGEKLSCLFIRASKDGMLSLEKYSESLILVPRTEVLSSSMMRQIRCGVAEAVEQCM
jgi:hypothetical protein